MTNLGIDKWEVRPRCKSTSAPEPAAAPKPSTLTDFTHNKQLAQRARLSVQHDRAQKMICNWLLIPGYGQQQADYAAKVLEACAALRGTSTRAAGGWDTVAHCLALTLYHNQRSWLVQWSGFVIWGQEDFHEAVQLVFGNRFVGEPFIGRLDIEGDAMLVTAAPY